MNRTKTIDIEGSFYAAMTHPFIATSKKEASEEKKTTHLPQLHAHKRNLHVLSRLVVHTHLKDEVLGVIRHRLLGDKLHKLTHPIVLSAPDSFNNPGKKTHLRP
jgi:hypothetical protein